MPKFILNWARDSPLGKRELAECKEVMCMEVNWPFIPQVGDTVNIGPCVKHVTEVEYSAYLPRKLSITVYLSPGKDERNKR